MKKLFMAAAALFVFASAAQAQNFKWGVEIGANLGRVTGDNYFKTAHTIGFQVGPYIQYQFSNLVGIQPELLFNDLNIKPENTSTTNGSSGYFEMGGSTVGLPFLSLPILVRFNLSKSFSLQIGPQFDALLHNQTYVDDGIRRDAFRAFNAGGTVAAQFDLGDWLIYGRFNMGLTNIDNSTVDTKWHTQEFQLGIGYNLSHLLHKQSASQN